MHLQDYENVAAIQVAADHWASQGKDVPKGYRAKVSGSAGAPQLRDMHSCARLSPAAQVALMCKYLDKRGPYKGMMEVPDPYYGGTKGFELVCGPLTESCMQCFTCAGAVVCSLSLSLAQVLDLLEDACEGLLQHILEHNLAAAS